VSVLKVGLDNLVVATISPKAECSITIFEEEALPEPLIIVKRSTI
jgi:hypothetical protein